MTTSSRTDTRGRERWWGLVLGLVMGAGDMVTMIALGVTVSWGSRDVTVPVLGYFAGSFGLLGYLAGYALEGRRRAREAAALIRAQAETIAAARARLAQHEKLAVMGQLAAQIAHEVRNPLAVIRSAAQGIAETLPPGDADSSRACSFITEEIDRLSNVVTSLLAIARPPQVTPRPTPVGDLLDRALLLAREDLAAKQVHVERSAAADLPPISADADLMCQVLLGFLANAAEAVAPGGRVTLEAVARDGAVELAVADSGPGVPPELRDRVFDAFFTTRPRGVGLGLAVARQIVELHGGRIEVGERHGGGARFAVRLPVAA